MKVLVFIAILILAPDAQGQSAPAATRRQAIDTLAVQFASDRTHSLSELDERIERLTTRRRCVAKAADHRQLRRCYPPVRDD
jgi:hypothetical protein